MVRGASSLGTPCEGFWRTAVGLERAQFLASSPAPIRYTRLSSDCPVYLQDQVLDLLRSDERGFVFVHQILTVRLCSYFWTPTG